jgi:general secretion pathway protein I
MSSRKRKICFNSPYQGRPSAVAQAGFTLLEVMIAVALIAIALVTLIGAQAQSVSIASASRFDAMASLLAQWKLTDMSRQEFEILSNESGNFGKDYPNFSWKAEVNEVGENETGLKGSDGQLKTIDVTVLNDRDPSRIYIVRTIVHKQPVVVQAQ